MSFISSHHLYTNIYIEKKIKCFGNYIPLKINPNILNEDYLDVVIDEVVDNKDFEKSDTEIETFDKIEQLKYPKEYENNSIIIPDDLIEKEINNDKIQAMFKRGRNNI